MDNTRAPAHLSSLLRVARRARNHDDIAASDKKKIATYLTSPVSTGLWNLSAAWLPTAGISAAIWSEIEKEIKDKDSVAIRSGKRDRRIKITEEWSDNLKSEVSSKITFFFTLFNYLHAQDLQQPEDDAQFNSDHEITQLVLDLIDVTEIFRAYAEALKHFKENIWHSNFKPSTVLDQPTRLKNGSFILQKAPIDNGSTLVAISWDDAPLRDLKRFFDLLGKVENASIMPIFSPEEEVFAPYFNLLSMAYETVVPQEHLQPLILKAITNFNEYNYTDSVSSIGLASEDVLTQIYETLYREQLTKGLTLGQLADELHARAAAKFRKKEDSVPDLSALFPELKAALEDPALASQRTVELLRRMVVLTIEANKHLIARVDKIGKPERRYSIYPESVSHAVTELIRYRNAASHKSRIPIGPMECRRAAHSFIVLMSWWLQEKTMIDWSKTADEIVRECAERNSKI